MAAFLKHLSLLLLAGACLQSAARAVTIDVMILFDQSAVEFINRDPREIAQQAVGQLNTVFSNSGLRDVHARLVYQGKVDYRTQARPGGDGVEHDLGNLAGGKIKNALELRDRYGADLVTMFVHYSKDAPGGIYTAGLGTALRPRTSQASETCAFNIVLVDTVFESNITYPHEIGHQLGCGHNDLHAVQTGPQYHDFSAGFYNLPKGYGTLMCYSFFIHKNDRERNQISPILIRPCLSSPDVVLVNGGLPLGDASHNNAKTCRLNAPKVAQYRQPGRNAPKAPENDQFASAKEITEWETENLNGETVSISVGEYVNRLATREQGEPLHGVSGKTSVWFRFVPPEDGVLEAATLKSRNTFVPFLAVYTGTGIRNLRRLAVSGSSSSPSFGEKFENPVRCAVRKGRPVFLAVDGRDGDAGKFCLLCSFLKQELPPEEPPATPPPGPSPSGNGPQTPPSPQQPPPSGGDVPAPEPASPPQTPPQEHPLPPAPSPVHGGDALLAALFLLSGGVALVILLQLRILSRQKQETDPSDHLNAWKQEWEKEERSTPAQGEENSIPGGLRPHSPEPGGTRVVPGLGRPPGPALVWSGALSTGAPVEYRIPLEHVSRQGRYSIGRSPDNDLPIPDPTVSSFHAVLEIRGGALHIGDMGSANGTMVNNLTLHRKEFARLRAGDRITLGQASFLLSQS